MGSIWPAHVTPVKEQVAQFLGAVSVQDVGVWAKCVSKRLCRSIFQQVSGLAYSVVLDRKLKNQQGVENGMSIRINNAGDAPITGKGSMGDLLVRINVASSKNFVRQGSNLYHEARIPFHTAILGGRVRVPTLDGEVDVRIPTGTQPGEEMVLKGRGVPSVYGSSNGDLFVTFSMIIPRLASH